MIQVPVEVLEEIDALPYMHGWSYAKPAVFPCGAPIDKHMRPDGEGQDDGPDGSD